VAGPEMQPAVVLAHVATAPLHRAAPAGVGLKGRVPGSRRCCRCC
jgi:hypothetical protein